MEYPILFYTLPTRSEFPLVEVLIALYRGRLKPEIAGGVGSTY